MELGWQLKFDNKKLDHQYFKVFEQFMFWFLFNFLEMAQNRSFLFRISVVVSTQKARLSTRKK